MKKKSEFVPLEMGKMPKYMHTRKEVLDKAKEILKHFWFKELALEDRNKISFRTNDIDYRDLRRWMVEFEDIDEVYDINIEDARKQDGFWVIIMFDSLPNFSTFPLGRKRMRKIGRLKGDVWR